MSMTFFAADPVSLQLRVVSARWPLWITALFNQWGYVCRDITSACGISSVRVNCIESAAELQQMHRQQGRAAQCISGNCSQGLDRC